MVNLRKLISLYLCSIPVHAAVIYFDNGIAISVPESTWQVEIHPIGFNSLPYSKYNPKGKLPGFGGWPEYSSCKGQLTLGGVCEEPYFITVPVEEPVEGPEGCTPKGELSLGGPPCK